jgi:hypothetical protein
MTEMRLSFTVSGFTSTVFLMLLIAPLRASTVPSAPTLLTNKIDAHKSGWRVIYFWSAACPCVRACERYSFIPLASKYKGKVSFYAIATNGYDLQLPRKELNADIAQHHLPYPVLFDTDHSIAKYFDAKVTPQTFVIDPAGHVVFNGMPDDSRRFLFTPNTPKNGNKGQVPESYLAKALAQAMAGKAVTETPLKEAGCSIAW